MIEVQLLTGCEAVDWAPSWWGNPYESDSTAEYKDIVQWFSWNQSHLDSLHDWCTDHNGQWQHEVRRTKSDYKTDYDVWNFLMGGWFSCWCTMGTNLPDPDPWRSEEKVRPLACPLDPDYDEEAEIISRSSLDIQADVSYYVLYRFWRAVSDETVYLTFESEIFGRWYLEMEYCEMWRGSWTS
jgi:hypothetical protein